MPAPGSLLLAVGFGCLAFAHPNSERPSPLLVIVGTIATTFGMLFVGPLFIRGLAALGRRAPIALRLALRDLARYQARSAAALGAISLALAIAATVAISAAAAAVPPAEANLANNQIIVSLGSDNGSAPREGSAPISEPTAAELRSLQTRVDALAASLHAQAAIPVTEAVDQASAAASAVGTLPDDTATLGNLTIVSHGAQSGIKISGDTPLYVATPALLAHFGISPSAINANTDVITGRTDLAGFAVIAPQGGATACNASQTKCRANVAKPAPGSGGAREVPTTGSPLSRSMKLPRYTSAPDTLLTTHALEKFGLKPVAAGWFIQTRRAHDRPGQLGPARCGRGRHHHRDSTRSNRRTRDCAMEPPRSASSSRSVCSR